MGQPLRCTLTLEGELGSVGAGRDGTNAAGFSHEFDCRPLSTGLHDLGPYELRLGQETLRSNRARVRIELPPAPGQVAVVVAERETVAVGESFRVHVSSSTLELGELVLRGVPIVDRRHYFDIGMQPPNARWIYELKPRRAGKLVIDRSSFDSELPDLEVIPAEIVVYSTR